MVTILMMSAKMVTPGLLKIISDHDVISKFLSRDSNYIKDVVM